MTYAMGPEGTVVRQPDGACIPPDPNNKDYQEFLAWAKTNVVAPFVPPLPPPVVADRTDKLIAALVKKGILKDTDLL